MKKLLLSTGLTFLAANSMGGTEFTPTYNDNIAHNPPYERGMIFEGGGANTPMFLGELAGAADAGKPIDVIVGTCGGGIAAAIANRFPHPSDQLAFLQSKEFYDFLRQMKQGNFDVHTALKAYMHERASYNDWYFYHPEVPKIDGHAAIDLLPYFRFPGLEVPFNANSIHVAIGAARVEFDHKDWKKPITDANRKMYTEVYFTDEETARALTGLRSYTGQIPSSYIRDTVEPIVGVDLTRAIRASIADPGEFSPITIKGHVYASGAADLDAIHVLKALARETVGQYNGTWSNLESTSIKYNWGYDPVPVRQAANEADTTYVVDFSQDTKGLRNMSMHPMVWHQMSFFDNWKALSIGNPIADLTYEQFKTLVQDRWDFGYARGLEALKQPPLSKAHIRERKTSLSAPLVKKPEQGPSPKAPTVATP